MTVRGNFTRLSKPLYLLGVPTKLFVLEIAACVIGTIIMKKWVVVPIVAVIHFIFLILYKISPDWRKEFTFYLNIPFRRVYKGKIAYLPKSEKM